VDALRHHLAVAAGSPDVYLCGPPGLLRAAQAVGVPDAQVFSEAFVAAAA
jgi:ferredoxin-NADP reductase